MTVKNNGLTLGNNTYDILRQVTQYWLPALATLYFTLAGIWGFPFGEQVIGTIAALEVFLGVILGISKSSWKNEGNQITPSDQGYDGALVADLNNPEKDIYSIEVNEEPSNFIDKGYMVLKVENPADSQ